MDPEKKVGDYCDNIDFDRIKVQYYNVLTLRICRAITKLVTYTDSIKSVKDLR